MDNQQIDLLSSVISDEENQDSTETLSVGEYAIQIKQDLISRFQKLERAYNQVSDGIEVISAISGKTGMHLPWIHNLLNCTFNGWLDEILCQYSALYSGISNDRLEMSDIKTDDDCFYVGANDSFKDGFDRIERFDFEALITSIECAAKKLETRGIVKAADSLAYRIGLTRDTVGSQCGFKGKYFIFELLNYASYESYHFRALERFTYLKNDMEVFERESGFEGLVDAIDEMIRETSNLGYVVPHPTNHILAKNSPLECVCFKEKFKLRMSPEIGSALVSFVKDYSTRDLK